MTQAQAFAQEPAPVTFGHNGSTLKRKNDNKNQPLTPRYYTDYYY